MGKRHYSGKDLIYRRKLEKQRQQREENTVRQRVQDINQLKRAVETARQDMRKNPEKKCGGILP